MSAPQWISGFLLLAGLAAGTLADTPRKNQVIVVGGYRVLAADFHVHSFPLSWATLGPWDTVLEARQQGLDVIAITAHNHLWVSRVGQWFSQLTGGPTVLVGEEIHTPKYHLLAVGIRNTISWRLSAAKAIDEVHRQGGVAIAAHPLSASWPAFDTQALRTLDGAEVLHPTAYTVPGAYRQLQEFYRRGHFTAVGDSDYHGRGPMGLFRTFVFSRDDSEAAVLEALRHGRTVVFDRDGRALGDPELIRLAANDRRFDQLRFPPSDHAFLSIISRVCGVFGLLGVLIFGNCSTSQHRRNS